MSQVYAREKVRQSTVSELIRPGMTPPHPNRAAKRAKRSKSRIRGSIAEPRFSLLSNKYQCRATAEPHRPPGLSSSCLRWLLPDRARRRRTQIKQLRGLREARPGSPRKRRPKKQGEGRKRQKIRRRAEEEDGGEEAGQEGQDGGQGRGRAIRRGHLGPRHDGYARVQLPIP